MNVIDAETFSSLPPKWEIVFRFLFFGVRAQGLSVWPWNSVSLDTGHSPQTLVNKEIFCKRSLHN
jgi:hypothetical protein